MRYLFFIGFVLSLAVSASDKITVNSSSNKTAVVELYTSQGCSSCPPADRWLKALIKTAPGELDVLALAFHVDYWDYIGWKDRFASPGFTSRQRQLAANNRQSSLYTPEFFVDGREARGADEVLAGIRRANATQAKIELELGVTRVGNGMSLELIPDSDRDDLSGLHYRFIVYEKNLTSDVSRGENSGKILQHQHVVRYMSPARKLGPSNSHLIPVDPAWKLADIGVAALVTTPGNLDYLNAVYTPIRGLVE